MWRRKTSGNNSQEAAEHDDVEKRHVHAHVPSLVMCLHSRLSRDPIL